MKNAAVLLFATLLVSPTAAQSEGIPLLRVYIDAPYFYDFLAYDSGEQQGRHHFELVIEGKEVGSAAIELDCADDTFSQTIDQDWSGAAADFVPSAVLAYRHLFCGQ